MEFVTILFLFYVSGFFVFCHETWNLSFPSRDQTCIPCIEMGSLHHWTTRKVPIPEALTEGVIPLAWPVSFILHAINILAAFYILSVL